jgi:uncharacterized repeat protein (TIGR04052 family)
LTDLRFFVSAITLIDASGIEYDLDVSADEQWQQEGLALIDLENGLAACLNGSEALNASVSGTAPEATFTALRFTLGVPFELNHANPLIARPPLDNAAMHWHWRSGYKFLRAGVATDSDSFWIHLGSTGCEGTVQNISGCRYPNRVVVELNDFTPGSDQVEVDLAALFLSVDLDDGKPSDCSSGPAESACVEPFSALGLPLNNNMPGPIIGSQNVFRTRR